MTVLDDLREKTMKGKRKETGPLVQQALDEGLDPQEILDADLYFIDEIGLKEHLSPTRSNGLLAMVKQMRMYALAFQTKQD